MQTVRVKDPYWMPKVDEAVRRMEELSGVIRQKGQIPIMEIREYVLPLIQEVIERADVYPLLLALRSKNDYLYRHPVAVSIIATLIGKWLELPENEVNMLTVGALLHNAGSLRLSESIVEKKGPLDEEEFEQMKRHTVIGYEMLERTVGLSRRSALIALQHHEREDGTGYPLRLAGSRTDPLSKITAVADVFHALGSDRMYRPASPFYEVLRQMYNGSLGRLDPRILHAFTQRLMNAMVGCAAELSDGRRGKIVMLNPVDPTAPLIQLGGTFVDLGKEPELRLERVIG
ncbi:HD-GYP domain-containing protein [Cohnella caldifontis]|uniref:HD-GYP domain-containing protein n=1 Tax=Cohnella caldifontis TaxID=3027471 RepID=UPI0023EBB910|nr:HD-GYP domain-containing protein [Cohnella sp. YIM B05605]